MKNQYTVPAEFPTFAVSGYEDEMASLRALCWLHYPGSTPKATMWDEWLPRPSLWPQSASNRSMRDQWREALSNRVIDSEGYVAVHQHPSIAHPLGWPFPMWIQAQGGFGWHFSFKDTPGEPWRQKDLDTTDGWTLENASAVDIGEFGWNLTLDAPDATITVPRGNFDTYQSPFVQLRWTAQNMGDAQPFIEWTTEEKPDFDAARRVYFESVEGRGATYYHESPTVRYSVVPMYPNAEWTGRITQLRVSFGNTRGGGRVTIQALFSTYDTRHNTNTQSFVTGCAEYFAWTRDLSFLRANINRMRLATHYVMKEHHTLERKVVFTDWVGHDGRAALWLGPERGAPILDDFAREQGVPRPSQEHPEKKLLGGHGIGNNYWDLLPFGHLDCYATLRFYGSLLRLAHIERDILAHPEWNVPRGVLAFAPEELERHAAEIKEAGNEMFWNEETGRFAPGIDADGKMHDYGLTFLNLEAIHYDFATPQHASRIMSWIDGSRFVDGDTSQGTDIYHWRFGPRATTRRNIEYYLWAWAEPEALAFGGQVQDGGAVLGFTYHDLMSRLRVNGADDAAVRLKQIAEWFGEVHDAGDYRAYYKDGRDGATLQGGGTAGGLGLDHEFFESAMATQVLLDGFLGFSAHGDGFSLHPQLPSDWPELQIDRIAWHDLTLAIRVTPREIEVRRTLESTRAGEPALLHLPHGKWTVIAHDDNGALLDGAAVTLSDREGDSAFRVDWNRVAVLQLFRAAAL